MQGLVGFKGKDSTIEISKVNTVDSDQLAAVINNGTPSKAKLEFNIPRGKDGHTPIFNVLNDSYAEISELKDGSYFKVLGRNSFKDGESYLCQINSSKIENWDLPINGRYINIVDVPDVITFHGFVNEPFANTANGVRYITGTIPSGEFLGIDPNVLAIRQSNLWTFVRVPTGRTLINISNDATYSYDGANFNSGGKLSGPIVRTVYLTTAASGDQTAWTLTGKYYEKELNVIEVTMDTIVTTCFDLDNLAKLKSTIVPKSSGGKIIFETADIPSGDVLVTLSLINKRIGIL